MLFRKIFRVSIKVSLALIVMLAIAEGILRLTSFNNNVNLFTESRENSNLLELNKGFTRKNVNNLPGESLTSIPFQKIKDKDAIRIFIVGEHVNINEPDNPNASFSHILNRFLQRTLPDKNIELVNIAFNSSSSFVQYDIVKQLKKYDTDIVFICPGRDEFKVPHTYAFGNTWLNRNLPKLRLFQSFEKLLPNKSSDESGGIALGTRLLKIKLASFEKNLNDMIVTLHDNDIPVLLLNTSNNLLDMPPQKSYFSAPDSGSLKILFEKGKQAYLNNDCDLAYSCLSRVNQKDKAHAETAYYLGKLALRENDTKTAKKYLQQAVETDKLRFRSPSEINRIIFKTSVLHGIPLVDIEGIFAANSLNGIPGNNLFAGPHQANLYGNILTAKECYKTLIKEKLIIADKYADARSIALTPFDTAYDRICSELYGGKFTSGIELQTTGSFEEKTVLLFANKKVSWEESMNKLYDYYIANKNFDLAFRIIENLALENPYNVSINDKASIAASFLGDSQLVVHYAKKVYRMKPRVEVAQRLFLNYLKLDMPENAKTYLEYARKNKINGNDLNVIYAATCRIIDLKKLLNKHPEDKALKRMIAQQYYEMGNDEIGREYEVRSTE